MKIMKNFEIIKSTDEELKKYNSVGEEYKKYSFMSDQDRSFLTSLILRKQPKKILELGVALGGSSLVILNTIKEFSDTHLYSHDYSEKFNDKKMGYYVDNFPELKNKWSLFTGGLILNYLDEIGGDIDFCLIDTAHVCPGEILDFLMVLPYLSKDATVVFHDTNLFMDRIGPAYQEKAYTTHLLMSAVSGKKLIPAQEPYVSFLDPNIFTNIGAVEVNENTFANIYEIFNLLAIKWYYMPSAVDLVQFSNFINRFYDEYYMDYFEGIVKWQQKVFEDSRKKLRERERERESLCTNISIPFGSVFFQSGMRSKEIKITIIKLFVFLELKLNSGLINDKSFCHYSSI